MERAISLSSLDMRRPTMGWEVGKEGDRRVGFLTYPRYCNYLFPVADISFFRLTINPAVKMLELRCMRVFDRGPLNWILL